MQCWLFTQDNFYLHMMNLIRPGCLFCSSMNKEANSSRSCVTDYLSLNMKCCESCKRSLTHFLTVSLWLVILYMQFYHWEWSSGSLPFIYIRAWSCFPLKRAKTWWKRLCSNMSQSAAIYDDPPIVAYRATKDLQPRDWGLFHAWNQMLTIFSQINHVVFNHSKTELCPLHTVSHVLGFLTGRFGYRKQRAPCSKIWDAEGRDKTLSWILNYEQITAKWLPIQSAFHLLLIKLANVNMLTCLKW